MINKKSAENTVFTNVEFAELESCSLKKYNSQQSAINIQVEQ